MSNNRLPFSSEHPCRCSDCNCSVVVTSHHGACRACRHGGHDARSYRVKLQARREAQRQQHAA